MLVGGLHYIMLLRKFIHLLYCIIVDQFLVEFLEEPWNEGNVAWKIHMYL